MKFYQYFMPCFDDKNRSNSILHQIFCVRNLFKIIVSINHSADMSKPLTGLRIFQFQHTLMILQKQPLILTQSFSDVTEELVSQFSMPAHSKMPSIQLLIVHQWRYLVSFLLCIKPGFHMCVSKTHNGARCLTMYGHQ